MSHLIPSLDDLKRQVHEGSDCGRFLASLEQARSEADVGAAVDDLVREWLAEGDPADG